MKGLTALAVLFLAAVTIAADYRLTIQLASGQTIEKFCSLFTAACPGVIASSQPNATVYQVCEQAPKADQANAYCTGSENGQITAYTTQVAAQLGASTT